MATSSKANKGSTSTTYGWKPVKVTRQRRNGQHGSAGGRRWHGLTRRPKESQLTLTVTYKGGSEAWWLVQARGRSGVFPGYRAIHDVMAEINREFGEDGEN